MSDASEAPASVGPFVVHRKLGEGAMGVVYAGYDVDLDRKVALKLVRRQLLDHPAVRDRMVREAKAMARLSSPHVVQVYQVGPHRDGIYVAMEYVEGESLDGWLKQERRGWQAILRTICGAGRGLAAAHAAGLVHRDFKPDNVLVDRAGHARVLDFGLVQSEQVGATIADADEPMQSTAGVEDTFHSSGTRGDAIDRSADHWSVRLTQLGRAVGTPAYMSPEQHFGDPIGPFSDQYSFAVTLYEALYGTRPFNGDSWDSLKAQIRRAEVPPPPPDSRVPGWVFRVLLRALSVEPDQRWPGMEAMVDALERDPRKTRLRVAGLAGLLGVASVASYAAAGARTDEPDRCGGGAHALVGVWDDARRQAVAAAFDATRTSFAADVLRRVESRLDGYTATWVAEHRAACEASVAGSQVGHLLDQRMACLARRRTHVSALVDVLATADRSVVENAVQAVAALPSLQACADAEALLAVPPPADAQMALRVDQLRRQLAQAEALEGTGRYEQGLVLATKVRGEADALGYAPLAAESALVEGSLLLAVGRSAEAEAALVEAAKLAIVQDMHAEAAEAAAKRIFVLSTGLRRHEAALAIQPMAEALVERTHDDLLAALLHNNLGVAYTVAGDLATGTRHFEATIAQLTAGDGPQDPLIAATYNNLGNLYVEQDRPQQARASFTAALELFTTLVGDRHPHAAWPLRGLGQVALKTENFAEAERFYGDALTLMEAAFGPTQLHLIHPLVGLGRVYTRTGRAAEAARSYGRAITVGEQAQGNDPGLAEALEELGELTSARGEHAEARRLFERAVAANEAAHGKDSGKQARSAVRAAAMALELGDHAGAIAWYERVLALPTGATGEARVAAAVGLAREQTASPETTARACDLLAEPSLPASLRGEAEALRASRCAGRTPRGGHERG